METLQAAFPDGYPFFKTAGACLLFVGLALARRRSLAWIANLDFSRSIVNYCRRLILTRFKSQFMDWSRRTHGPTGSHRLYRCANTAIKFGTSACHYEAGTIEYIARHTSIPVPKLFDVWTREDGSQVTVMEWVEGEKLEKVWPTLSSEEKKTIAHELRGHLDTLRALRPPTDSEGWIGSYDKGSISDALLGRVCGPFSSDDEFNNFLLSRLNFMKETKEGRAELEEFEKELLKCPPRRVLFTHSDLLPRNILIDSRRKIVAILDWEMSGWMPEQWEYVKAMWMGQYDEGWPEFVATCFDPYDDDLRLHMKMCEMHGAPFMG